MLTFCESPEVLPPCVTRVSARFNADLFSELSADELGVRIPTSLTRAVRKRRAEYVVGRYCAARALCATMPTFTGDIAIGADRGPCWPAGVVGSITHAGDFVSAAVASVTLLRGVGIDTENILTTETMTSVRHLISTGEDRAPAEHGLADEIYYALLFSAKESVFKCLYPIARRMFYFEHAAVRFAPESQTFRATLRVDLGDFLRAGFALDGRYSVSEPYVHTGVTV